MSDLKIAADVSSFEELSDALHIKSVNVINVMSDITFTQNILSIPLRDVSIFGRGHKITSKSFAIYGAVSTAQQGVLRLFDMTIEGHEASGRIFEHVSTGWDMEIRDVVYSGSRLAHLSRGTLTCSGQNSITTTHENAWVENVIFEEGCSYEGVASLTASTSAFYFNGLSKNGSVILNKKSNVKLKVGGGKYDLYPAFYDRVNLIDVGDSASLDINSYGYAIHFIRADMDHDAKVIVAENAVLNLNGEGGGNKPTVKFDFTGNIEVEKLGALTISGNPKSELYAVIEMAKGSEIKLGAVAYTKIFNQRKGGPLFNATQTTFSTGMVSSISVWGKSGGDYESPAMAVWKDTKMATTLNKDQSSNTTSTDESLQASFQMSAYGCIELISNVNP
ncbi:pectate lyase-like adhesive domain-containing protein [Serratia marcescens]|uniref:pectate lyase-like adhesive domain-containing protein n=1 Tax=Serratia marcescens TaxID=615 RepID=UPI00148BE84A|nr:pectate lyase-like adhesive domain-containing protein [Serratia marcescens]QJU42273.1 hypothetical protein HMI62_24420 [Serratia marcescens]